MDLGTGAAVGPPVQHGEPINHAVFSPDPRWLATTTETTTPANQVQPQRTTPSVWDLSPDLRDPSAIRLTAQALSGRRLDASGDLTPLSAAELHAAWKNTLANGAETETGTPPVA